MICISIFFVSFFSYYGQLNENEYIKQLAFFVMFLFLGVISIVKIKFLDKVSFNVTIGDIFIILFLLFYSLFYINTNNNLNFTLPFAYFLFYIFLRLCISKENDFVDTLNNIIPLVLILHLIICLLQFAKILPNNDNFFPVGSSFGNPDKLGAYMAVLLPFCYVGMKKKIFTYFVFILCIILFFLLESRTALLASTVTFFSYLIISGRVPKKSLLFIIPILILGLVALIQLNPLSVSGRLFIWIVSGAMILAKPWGWGLYAFEKHYPKFQTEFILKYPELSSKFNLDMVHSPFNEFLNIGVTLGMIPFLLYIAFVLYLLYVLYRKKTPLLYPLISFQIISLSYFPFKVSSLVLIVLLFVANAVAGYFNSLKMIQIKPKTPLIIILIAFSFLCFPNMFNYRHWRIANDYSKTEKTYDKSNTLFEKLYPTMKGNGLFLLSYAELAENCNDDRMFLMLMQETTNYYVDAYILRILSFAYEKNGCLDDAEEYLNLAVNMSHNNYSFRYEQMLFFHRIGKEQEAYDLAIKLYNTKSEKSIKIDIMKTDIERIIKQFKNNNL
jgi:Lipid A core - O-antigen ligase and related enzymes